MSRPLVNTLSGRLISAAESVRRSLNLVERRAREKGVKVLGLDTSEEANHLIALYRSKGYEFVEHVRWPDVNYRSVILSKSLA